MNWIEEVFLSDLECKIRVFNLILKLPEDVIMEPIKCQSIDKKYFTTLLTYYSNTLPLHLKNIPMKRLKVIIDAMKDLIDPNLVMETDASSLTKLFSLFLVKKFTEFFTHKALRNKYDKLGSRQLQEIISQIDASSSEIIKKIHLIFKMVIEEKLISSKVTNLSMIKDKFKFDLVTPTAGTLSYDSLPSDLQERFKTVMTTFEFEFFKNLLNEPKIQLLIKTGHEKLAPKFAEKIQKILQQESTALAELERREMIERLSELFVKDANLDDSVEMLADNVQQCEVDGRVILSQVFDTIMKQKCMKDFNTTLRTILIDSGLSKMEDLPNFNLTGPECMFALAMDFIESCNENPSTISVNILGRS